MQDTPILRADLLNMSQEQYEQWLSGVRERMMAHRRKYEEVERAKSLARVDKLTPKLDKLRLSLAKKMDKIDTDIEKVQIAINKALTLIKEIEDEQTYGTGTGTATDDGGNPELVRGGKEVVT